jgi:hypothetical protein
MEVGVAVRDAVQHNGEHVLEPTFIKERLQQISSSEDTVIGTHVSGDESRTPLLRGRESESDGVVEQRVYVAPNGVEYTRCVFVWVV